MTCIVFRLFAFQIKSSARIEKDVLQEEILFPGDKFDMIRKAMSMEWFMIFLNSRSRYHALGNE